MQKNKSIAIAHAMGWRSCTVDEFSKDARMKPKTKLGARLLELRMQAIAKGIRLLSWGEINEEVKQRRGDFQQEHGSRRS